MASDVKSAFAVPGCTATGVACTVTVPRQPGCHPRQSAQRSAARPSPTTHTRWRLGHTSGCAARRATRASLPCAPRGPAGQTRQRVSVGQLVGVHWRARLGRGHTTQRQAVRRAEGHQLRGRPRAQQLCAPLARRALHGGGRASARASLWRVGRVPPLVFRRFSPIPEGASQPHKNLARKSVLESSIPGYTRVYLTKIRGREGRVRAVHMNLRVRDALP